MPTFQDQLRRRSFGQSFGRRTASPDAVKPGLSPGEMGIHPTHAERRGKLFRGSRGAVQSGFGPLVKERDRQSLGLLADRAAADADAKRRAAYLAGEPGARESLMEGYDQPYQFTPGMTPGAYDAYRTEANSNLRLGAARGLQQRNAGAMAGRVPTDHFWGMSGNDIAGEAIAQGRQFTRPQGQVDPRYQLPGSFGPSGAMPVGPGGQAVPQGQEWMIGPDGSVMPRLDAPLAGVPMGARQKVLSGNTFDLKRDELEAAQGGYTPSQLSSAKTGGLIGKYAPGRTMAGGSVPFRTASGDIGLRGQNVEIGVDGKPVEGTYGRSGPLADRYAAQVERHGEMKSRLFGGEIGRAMRQRHFAQKSGDRLGMAMAEREISRLRAEGQNNTERSGGAPRDASKLSVRERAEIQASIRSDLNLDSRNPNGPAIILGINPDTPANSFGNAVLGAMLDDASRMTNEDLQLLQKHLIKRHESDRKFYEEGEANSHGRRIVDAIINAGPNDDLKEIVAEITEEYRTHQQQLPTEGSPLYPGF